MECDNDKYIKDIEKYKNNINEKNIPLDKSENIE